MTTEDKVPALNQTAQISLTDCLACSGCVTSAEAVLVSLQSHLEVLNALSSRKSARPQELDRRTGVNSGDGANCGIEDDGMLFVASVSPQSRASLAAAYGISERAAGNMIEQFLSGPRGIRKDEKYGAGFTWTVDTNVARELCLVLGADDVLNSLSSSGAEAQESKTISTAATSTDKPQRPILTSACPGWICYAEKTHPHVLPYLSRLKSPQALLGTMLKTTLSRRFGIAPDRIWHLAIMPCFDKKLEASREEFTDAYWREDCNDTHTGVRDVDCVITTKELLMLAETVDIPFSELPREPVDEVDRIPFPDPKLDAFLLGKAGQRHPPNGDLAAGTSGGYLHHILQTFQSQHPGSQVRTTRGRNADVVEHTVVAHREGYGNMDDDDEEIVLLRTARYYGFRNIQNLVRKLKPPKMSRMPGARSRLASARQKSSTTTTDVSRYAYVEVMACPGGCTNGGGQIKVSDVPALRAAAGNSVPRSAPFVDIYQPPDNAEPAVSSHQSTVAEQREWLSQVDEAYFSASDDGEEKDKFINGTSSPLSANTSLPDDAYNPPSPSILAPSPQKQQQQLAPPSTSVASFTSAATPNTIINGLNVSCLRDILQHWSSSTAIPLDKLIYTTYRAVESDVGNAAGAAGTGTSTEKVVESLAGKIGGGW